MKHIEGIAAKCKPCPHCGHTEFGTPSMEIEYNDETMTFNGSVTCWGCFADGPWVSRPLEEDALREAVELWNRRVGQDGRK